MKEITGFKQKEDRTDGSLDRANELDTFFKMFSSETSSASFSPAHSQTDIPPSFDPQLSCNPSNVFFFHLSHGPFCFYMFAFNHIGRCGCSLGLPLPPVCLKKSGEETTGKTEPEQGCRSRSCQP
ncbi:hypothetical protein ILYODFUR_038233 [Ilyodon furcidens]|uniref:Uncharacterized protein n=1 Tax=Ilyodon furcidens TaxID=33524 RepID=A0ABV0UC77_9TELE